MKVVLTGEPGVGKTTAIKKLVKLLKGKVVGFWTEEVRDPHTKQRRGFKVVSTEGKSSLFASKTFTSKHLVGSYGVNVQRFESVALEVLEKALSQRDKVIVIDEVGKMELFSKAFVSLVEELIQNPKYTVVVTIPIRDVHPLVAKIRRLQSAVLLEVNKENRDRIPEQIVELLKTA